MINILITGGTGLIGNALITYLLNSDSINQYDNAQNHITQTNYHLTVYSRTRILTQKQHNNLCYIDQLPQNNLDHFDVIINLAGEPIMNKRWRKIQKQRIQDSRWQLTQQLTALALAGENPPHTWLNASATGIYGSHTASIDEQTPLRTELDQQSFTELICQGWEFRAQQLNIKQHLLSKSITPTRICFLRTGIVLSTKGGMLHKLLLPFKLGMGAILGDGKQYIPWIHIDDQVRAIIHLIEHKQLTGAFNLCSPNPTTQKEFSQLLAKQLHRPLWCRVPKIIINLLLGESNQLLFDNQQVLPSALLTSGFKFNYPSLNDAFSDLL